MNEMSKSLPEKAKVVIIGGGAVGTGVLYHLAKAGWEDLVLLERRELGCGTTWHAAGLVGQLRPNLNLTRLAQYTAELFESLEEETGQPTGFRQNGSLSVASDEHRFEELKRSVTMARAFGLEADVITPSEAKEYYPILNVDDMVGAVFIPKDGQINPLDVVQAYAKGARTNGARICENIKVTGISTENGRVCGVSTDQGFIAADIVVNCAGMWAREVGLLCGVEIPLHAAEHFYVVTEPIPGLPSDLPVMRDQTGYTYYKEDAGKLLVGAFEPNAKPWGMDGIPEDFSFDQLKEDWDHFEPALNNALHRVPLLNEVGIHTFFCGPESFTPDNRYYLGEAPNLKGFYVAAGFNSIGVQSSGGAGKVISEWIEKGHSPQDYWEIDIRRIAPFQNNSVYLRERISESLGLLYAMHWPFRQPETSRNIRKSPLHDRLAAQGACFGETYGWERADWYAPGETSPQYEYSYGRQNWFENNRAEHEAVRNNVGIFDLTSFAKFMVEGFDAEKYLNRICANNVAVEPGRVVYTQWLNERGGIEADLTVTRLGENRFLVVTGAAVHLRDLTWLRRNLSDDLHVVVTDVTSAYSVLSIMGPNSRELLSRVTSANLSNEHFPFLSSKEIELGMAFGRASRITYVGELGWELYIGTDVVQHVYDEILAAGDSLGLVHCGYLALNSLRIEKAYRHFGHDIADEDSPLEAGLGFAVAWDKPGGFIGKEALEKQRGRTLQRRLVQFVFEDPEPLIYHEEPIFRDGELVGRITSAMFGHTLGGCVGLGYVNCADGVTPDYINSGKFEIEVAGERFAARASLRPLYDPRSERPKA